MQHRPYCGDSNKPYRKSSRLMVFGPIPAPMALRGGALSLPVAARKRGAAFGVELLAPLLREAEQWPEARAVGLAPRCRPCRHDVSEHGGGVVYLDVKHPINRYDHRSLTLIPLSTLRTVYEKPD
jgi:hypothetical protein